MVPRLFVLCDDSRFLILERVILLLEEEFDKYTSHYDLSNTKLKSRYNHSYRVMELCEKYAKELGWCDSDVELAKIIGLLHDFGRFEQYRVYKSFIDKDTVDHADYSVEQLFGKGQITKFTDRVDDYELIKFAIKYHNKKDIPAIDDARILKFTKLIRDADKVDIMYVLGHEIHEQATDEDINPEILKLFYQHQLIPSTITHNINDRIIVQFAFVFDLNNDVVLKDYRKYFEDFYLNVEYKNKFKSIYEETIRYIEERMK